MPSKIILKKSSVASKVPVAGDLDFGELAINYTDSKLYFKKADGSIDAFTSSAAAAPVTSVGGYTGVVTATNLLDAIKTVDGAGSGLDADTLDGLSSASFYLASNPSGYTSNLGTVTSVGATSPVVSSGGTTPTISIPAATASVNGYMTAAYASKLDGIAAGATANTGTVTAVSGSGSVNGLSLSGTVTTSGSLTLGGSVSIGIDNITDEARLFNNMGQNHGTQNDFNAISDFGVRYVQGGTNGPTGVGTNQFYGFTLGLGNDYALSNYASQFYWPRAAQNADTYIYVRDKEGGAWGGWRKTKAGYADSAGSVDYNNLSNKTGGSGTYTTSGDYRSPIFYDSNDTGYYIDPNSYSRIRQLTVTQTRVDSSKYPVGHYTSGQEVFSIDPTWSQDQLREYFNSNSISWVADSTAPGGYAISISGNVNVGGAMGSGFPFIPVETDDTFYMEVYVKDVSGTNTHYMGSIDFNESFGNLGGNPGSYGYWVMSNNGPGTGWTKYSGYISGFGTSTGSFKSGTKYWTPQALFNYTGGGTSYISGWRVYRLAKGIVGRFPNSTVNSGEAWFGRANDRNRGTYTVQLGGGSSSGRSFEVVDYAWTDVMFAVNSANYVSASGSFRAPIFYDSNDTGYYIDPNSTGTSYRGRGEIFLGPNSSSQYLRLGGNGGQVDHSTVSTSNGNLHIDAKSGNNLYLAWYNGSDVMVGGGIQATIYYDRNDTSYFVDPHSTSYQRSLFLGAHDSGTSEFRFGEDSSGWYGDRWYWDSAYTLYRYSRYAGTDSLIHYHDTRDASRITYGRNLVFDDYGKGIVGTYSASRYQAVFSMGDSYKLPADGTSTGSLYGIAWSHPNAGGTAGNLNTHGALILENGSFLAALSGSIRSRDDMRTPIFYDSGNTGYYLDPNSVSSLYGLTLAGGSYFRPQNWIQFDGSYGLYWPNHYGAHLHANDLSTYTQIALRGGKNSYGGIYDQYSGVNIGMYDSSGNGGLYREGSGRWFQYYHVGNDCTGFGTSSTNSAYNIYAPKGVYSGGRVDGTIFYDSNDTSYYVDPNSTGVSFSGNGIVVSGTGTAGGFQNRTYTSGRNRIWSFGNADPYGISYFQGSGGYAASDSIGIHFGSAVADCNFIFRSNSDFIAKGNVTAYSDERLKTDWLSLPLDYVDQLSKVLSGTYTRTDTGFRQAGVGAQSLQKILPETVFEGVHLSVAYGNAALVSAVELAKRVVEQEARIKRLESLIEKLI